MDRPTCETCPYWSAHEPGVATTGTCRRTSPVPPALQEQADWFNNIFAGIWPVTEESDWCGEHPDFPAYVKALDEDWTRRRREAMEEDSPPA